MGKIKLNEEEEDDFPERWESDDRGIYEYHNIECMPDRNFEFKVLLNLTKTNKQGDEIPYKKVTYKIWEDLDNIGAISQVLNANGSVSKTKCSVYFANVQNHCVVKHSYEEIKKLKENSRIIVKGFKRW
jgi:hypothetical protein